MALPTQLFRSTGIPVCLWFFAKDKTASQSQGRTDRSGQVLFIDARNLGYMIDRAERSFADADILEIADTFRAWRRTKSSLGAVLTYSDRAGFCYSANLAEIKRADYALAPGRYVGAAETVEDDESIGEKIERLRKRLVLQFEESECAQGLVRKQLDRLS